MGEFLGHNLKAALCVGVCLGALGYPLSAQEGDAAKAKKKDAVAVDAKEAAPVPEASGKEPVKLADLWVLDFRMVKVGIFQPTEGLHRGENYWYMIYRVENKTGRDRQAFIAVGARSDKGKSYSSVHLPDVEAQIERKVGRPLWGRTDESEILRERAKEGEAAAEKGAFNYFPFKSGESRECLAIFSKLDPGTSKVTVGVEGLSNDLNLVQKEGGGRQVISRVYGLDLERVGDEYAVGLDQFRLLKEGWTKKVTDLVVPKEE